MNEDVLIKIIVVCIGVATVVLYYLNRRHRWKTYTGYTKGQITELKTRVKGTKCVCFEYVVDGRLYTGVTGTVMKAEEAQNKEIPVRYNVNHPERYIVPDPYNG